MCEQLSSLHVDTETRWGGGQQQVLYLVTGLVQRGLRAELVAREGSALAQRAAVAGVTVHTLPMRGEWDLVSAARLAGIIRRGGFAILHLHTSHAHGLGRLASLVARPRVIVSRRVVFPIRGAVRRRLKYLCGVDKYIAISYAVKEALTGAGVPAERVTVVPSGVDPGRFEGVGPASLEAEFGLPQGAELVGMVGRLVAGKGPQDFLAAAAAVAAEHDSARFVLVGEGEERTGLERQAVDLGIADRVAFAGFRADVPAVLASLDVFAMPSHAEGLCTAAIEAMMAGLPVVAASVGGLKEVVDDGRTGLLVPPRDPGGLARAISKLLADRSLRRRMGTQGRQRALDRFSVKNMVEKTIQIYGEVERGIENAK